MGCYSEVFSLVVVNNSVYLFQDIARLTFIAMRNEKIDKQLLTFAGPRAWTTQEVMKDFLY